MRRSPLLLVPLLAALLAAPLLPGAAAAQEATPSPSAGPVPLHPPSPPAASDRTSSPSPAATAAVTSSPSSASGTVVVTLADDRRTVTMTPGQRLEVRLEPQPDAVWEGLETGAPTLHLVRYGSTESGGLTASLEALSPGRYGGSSEVRPQTLSATTSPRCRATGPHCGLPSRIWSVDVVVADGPSVDGPLACAAVARAMPSPLPGTVVVTQADDGRTVRVRQDGLVQVYLDTCADPYPAPPRAGAPLYRESVRLDRGFGGMLDATFRPLATGTTHLTAPYDARCLHRTDAQGDGVCATVQRVFSVTVEVLPAATATPTPCAKPTYEGYSVSPSRVSSGDPVTVQGGRRDLCLEESEEPLRDFRLLATPQGGEEVEVTAVRARWFRYAEARPSTTTRYRLLMDGRALRPDGGDGTVVVDRVSGSCASELTLTGPARAAYGSTVRLTGRAPAGARVTVLFKRYGAPGYTPRRSLVAGPDGTVSTTWVASEDHRWYAATDRCDSAPGLTKAAPRITGPAVVRPGTRVVLRVEAVPGVRTTVFFRGAGEPFSARRTLTGSGTVTWTARSDQRYYALTRDTISNHGLTQVR